MRSFIVVAYYTKDTGYEEEIKNLEKSLKALSLSYHIQAIENTGSWIANTNYKATFCKIMLEIFKRPILYVDADAIMRQYPAFLDDVDCDMAAHCRYGQELLTGTLYFNNTANAKRIISEWIMEVWKFPNIWEQKNLAKVLRRLKNQVKVVDLPPTYCQIFDTMKNVGQPVIEHFQASRRLKKEVEICRQACTST